MAPSCKLELARFSAWLRIQDGAECGNISEDDLGNKMGRVHVPAQEIKKIQTRKVKALKESKEEKLEQIKKKKEKADSIRQNAIESVFGEDD